MIKEKTKIGQVETQFFQLASQSIGQRTEPWRLKRGGELPEVTLAYETYGTLSPTKDNVVLIFHALTGHQHVAGENRQVAGVGRRWTEECWKGWWHDFVGPSLGIDTDKYFVICANYLGGCYGSTGPLSLDPKTGKPYGGNFPWLTLSDIVDSQVRLLDYLGIEKLHAVVGISMGGFLALNFAARYPDKINLVVPIATSITLSVAQRILNFEQICAIEFDPDFKGGDYYGSLEPKRGLTLARMIGHKTYISLNALEKRARDSVLASDEFGQYRITHKIESYMLHQGQKFIERFDANTYLCILGVMQSIDLLADTGAKDFVEMFSACKKQKYMVFSIDSDGCFPIVEQQTMVDYLHQAEVPVRHVIIHSQKGHDAFLVEPELFMPYMTHALENEWWE